MRITCAEVLRCLASLGLVVVLAGCGRDHGAQGKAEESGRDVPHLEGNVIVFSDAFRERAGITFEAATKQPYKPVIRVVGTVSFDPSYVAAIGTRLRGTVRRTFKFEGDHVKPNEPLAEIESVELSEAQTTIATAQAAHHAAEIHARREEDLLAKGLTTAREAEVAGADLLTANAMLQAAQQKVQAYGGNATFGTFVLRSPIGGHVIERHVAPGQSVDPNVIGYKVADLDHLWIELSVFERDLASVHINDEVLVAPLASPNEKITGKIAHVGEVIDPATRSTDVRVTVEKPRFHLRVGQSVEATITNGLTERDAILIPTASVIYVDGKPTVFVSDGQNRARAIAVRVGGTDGTCYEVLEGVQPGQTVASAGVFALKSELFR